MRWLGILVAAVMGAGCGKNDGFTELRMLVETDLGPQEQGNVVRIASLDELAMGIGQEWPSFPLVVAISPGGPPRSFGLNVQLRPDVAWRAGSDAPG